MRIAVKMLKRGCGSPLRPPIGLSLECTKMMFEGICADSRLCTVDARSK